MRNSLSKNYKNRLQLTIIIINYNVKYFLEQCLYSVIAASNNIETEIIVVDNASSDDSISYLKNIFHSVHFVSNTVNNGFAKANNKALKFAKGKYTLFLNPDTILSENVLVTTLEFLENNSEVGAAGIQMIDGTGNFLPESKRSFPAVWSSFYKFSGIASLFSSSPVFNAYELGHLKPEAIHKVDVLSGACMFCRTQILHRLGGFDERYFMYGEDIDLSYSIRQAGYTNYYLGNCTIIHFKGESTKKYNAAYAENFYGAMLIYLQKHFASKILQIQKNMLYAAIYTTKQGSRLKAFIAAKFRKPINNNVPKNICIAGAQEDLQMIIPYFQQYNIAFTRASTEAIHSLQELAADEIIFCVGQLSYADSIQYISHFKTRYSYKWHQGKSACMVGSNFKNNTGETIPLK